MDTVEIFENQFSAILASPTILTQFYTFGVGVVALGNQHAFLSVDTMPLLASVGIGESLSGLVFAGFGLIVFWSVWLVSNTLNVLILISPWGGIDNILRVIKGSVVALISASWFIPVIGPYISLIISFLIIAGSLFAVAWAFRWAVFGTINAWDIMTFKNKRFSPEEKRSPCLLAQKTWRCA